MKSVLYPENKIKHKGELLSEPDYFKDLNLNQIVEAITGKKEFLKPYFYTHLHDIGTIQYRHDVMRDLEAEELFEYIKDFAYNTRYAVKNVISICERLARPESYNCNYIEKGRLLEAAKAYCKEINSLVEGLNNFDLKSKGLSEFREYIIDYARSNYFKMLQEESNSLKAELSDVKYCMLIKGNNIKVSKYENETDYSPEIEDIFHKFKEGAVKDYSKKLLEEPYAEHVEAGVLDMVAKIYPEVFSHLDEFIEKHKAFIDETIITFTEEVQFYISYLQYMEPFKQLGLQFCYPEVTSQEKDIYSYEGFDLALANKLISENSPVICNDFYIKDKERIIVVTGPNQGGKTTFARAFGQIHHLANLGCPVPGRRARLFQFDRIFTHFEREENIKTLNGKLQDELVRMHDILSNATPSSIIIVNEILSSTTLKDAVSIGKEIMGKVIEMDSLCVWVTFIDELSSLSEKNVSMVSTVVPEDPVKRTFKVVRSPADGLAYALHIAAKYRVTYDCLKERIKI